MEVLSSNSVMLSNYEVFSLLRGVDTGRKSQQPLATIAYSTLAYLTPTCASQQSAAVITALRAAVAPFRLTRAETLQLLNQRPASAVEIQLIVEESEERLTEGQVQQLLEVVARTLPAAPVPPAQA